VDPDKADTSGDGRDAQERDADEYELYAPYTPPAARSVEPESPIEAAEDADAAAEAPPLDAEDALNELLRRADKECGTLMDQIRTYALCACGVAFALVWIVSGFWTGALFGVVLTVIAYFASKHHGRQRAKDLIEQDYRRDIEAQAVFAGVSRTELSNRIGREYERLDEVW